MECDEGYEIIEDKNGHNYCFPHHKELNCNHFDNYFFREQVLKCETCNNNEPYYISTDQNDFSASICVPFESPTNCSVIDQYRTFDTSSLKCKACFEEFYQNDGFCQERKSAIATNQNCKTKNPISDTCLECVEGFFLKADGLECIAFPAGIENCRLYLDEKTCIGCAGDYFLKDNKCMEVQNKIDNCEYY